jgi:hypothetical protein
VVEVEPNPPVEAPNALGAAGVVDAPNAFGPVGVDPKPEDPNAPPPAGFWPNAD